MRMGINSKIWGIIIIVVGLLISGDEVLGIRIVIDKEECFSQDVQFVTDTLHLSFVLLTAHSPRDGLNLLVKGPLGDIIEEHRGKTSEMFKFVAPRIGRYHFCFINKSPHKETIEFDIHLTRYSDQFYDDRNLNMKHEHVNSLLEELQRLKQVLEGIIFEQHWFEAQTERQERENHSMSTRAILKSVVESAALIGASYLQVFLLRRMLERKNGNLYTNTNRI